MMAIVSVRIDDDDLLERIDVLAKQNDRSRSGQIVAMVRQALRSTAEVAAASAPPKADWFPYPVDQADARIVEIPQSSVAGQGSPHPTYQAEPEVTLCGYTEYDTDTGETYQCTLPAHSGRIRHRRW